MTLEQKLEFADRFTDLVEQLQQEENELNSNFKAFIHELSTTKNRSRSTRNSKSRRRGISDNEVGPLTLLTLGKGSSEVHPHPLISKPKIYKFI